MTQSEIRQWYRDADKVLAAAALANTVIDVSQFGTVPRLTPLPWGPDQPKPDGSPIERDPEKPVYWFRFSPADAVEIANRLTAFALGLDHEAGGLRDVEDSVSLTNIRGEQVRIVVRR